MANESATQQKIGGLQQGVARLDATVHEQTKRLDRSEADLKAAVTDLAHEVRAIRADLAAVSERCAALQRQSDRGWHLWQALLVLAISVAASAVTQLALRK